MKAITPIDKSHDDVEFNLRHEIKRFIKNVNDHIEDGTVSNGEAEALPLVIEAALELGMN